MIKRRIPEKYEIDGNIFEAIYQATGRKFEITLTKNIITLHTELTTQEIQNIKSAIMPLLKEIPDITL